VFIFSNVINPSKAMRIKESKTCLVCNKEFTWRKKWERDWENVKYCSERCRRSKKNKE
jgi:hypothetical protein